MSSCKRFQVDVELTSKSFANRLLIHGPDIIDSAILAIDKLSEEVQESMNKLIRRYRENSSWKYSRVKNLEDKKLKSLLPDAIDLLLQPKTCTDEDKVVEHEVDDDEQDLIWDSDDAMNTEEEEGNEKKDGVEALS
ncbi:hypothetical protein ILUMI_25103, partial [Ignelater luminosus]